MKLKLTPDQLHNVRWVQWHSARQDAVRAHAVDPTSEARTGVLRTVTGAVIPAEAVDAEPGTVRDSFSLQVLARAEEVGAARAEAAQARAAKAKPPADGVRVRGDVAEIWKDQKMLGTFPAHLLETLPEILKPHVLGEAGLPGTAKGPAPRRARKTAAA